MSSELSGSLLETLAVLQFTTFVFGGAIFWYVIFIGLSLSSYWYIALLYSLWWIYDRDTPHRSGRYLPFIRRLPIWKYLTRYFPIKLHKTADLDPSKNYIFAIHPHGLPAFGAMNLLTNATNFDETFPGVTMHVLGHSMHFYIPFSREVVIASGIRSVSAEAITCLLTKLGPGHAVAIAVGGVAEMALNDHQSYTLKLRNRKGFIRMALETGALVVPVFTFNEHRVYDIPTPKKGSVMDYVAKFGQFFSNSVPPLDVHGRWWWSGPFMPKPLPLNTVIGAPIDFTKLKSIKNGDQLVTECHDIYKDELAKLYNEHKGRFGDENTPLIFV